MCDSISRQERTAVEPVRVTRCPMTDCLPPSSGEGTVASLGCLVRERQALTLLSHLVPDRQSGFHEKTSLRRSTSIEENVFIWGILLWMFANTKSVFALIGLRSNLPFVQRQDLHYHQGTQIYIHKMAFSSWKAVFYICTCKSIVSQILCKVYPGNDELGAQLLLLNRVQAALVFGCAFIQCRLCHSKRGKAFGHARSFIFNSDWVKKKCNEWQ